MRAVDLDMIFIAGLNGSGPDHWQSRWRQRMPNARLVEQADWNRPHRDAWIAAVVAACEAARRPILLLAHSLGVVTLAHAAGRLPTGRVKGAFLVAPPSDEALVAVGAGPFAPAPTSPLPFTALSRRRKRKRVNGAPVCTTPANPATSTPTAAMALGRKARSGWRDS